MSLQFTSNSQHTTKIILNHCRLIRAAVQQRFAPAATTNPATNRNWLLLYSCPLSTRRVKSSPVMDTYTWCGQRCDLAHTHTHTHINMCTLSTHTTHYKCVYMCHYKLYIHISTITNIEENNFYIFAASFDSIPQSTQSRKPTTLRNMSRKKHYLDVGRFKLTNQIAYSIM